MRTCSKEQQPAGLATTPSKANIAGAPRLSCVKKFEKHRFGGELPYLFDNRSRPQDSTFLKGNLGACSCRPRFLQKSFGPCPQDDRSGLLLSLKPARRGHLISTVAPASVNFFLIVSASSLETPSFTVFGAPSTRSLASRSEEHTSELQSHSDLVCRLLLEKKKKNKTISHKTQTHHESL